MTDEEELEFIRAREECATPGPWILEKAAAAAVWHLRRDGRPAITVITEDAFNDMSDLSFLAAARTDIAALLAERDALRNENAGLREIVDALAHAASSQSASGEGSTTPFTWLIERARAWLDEHPSS
jgi:hypothetical protein